MAQARRRASAPAPLEYEPVAGNRAEPESLGLPELELLAAESVADRRVPGGLGSGLAVPVPADMAWAMESVQAEQTPDRAHLQEPALESDSGRMGTDQRRRPSWLERSV